MPLTRVAIAKGRSFLSSTDPLGTGLCDEVPMVGDERRY